MADAGQFVYDVWYQARGWIIEIDGMGFPFGTLILVLVAVSVAAGFVRFIGRVVD